MGIAEFHLYTVQPRDEPTGPEVIYVLSGRLTVTISGKPPITLPLKVYYRRIQIYPRPGERKLLAGHIAPDVETPNDMMGVKL